MKRHHFLRPLRSFFRPFPKPPLECQTSSPREIVKRGVWVRPFGTLIYLMPPLIVDENELNQLATAVCEIVSEIGRRP